MNNTKRMQKGKVIDFLLGVVIAILLGKLVWAISRFIVSSMLPKESVPVGLILLPIPAVHVMGFILLIFYFWKRRRYISYGIGLILIIFFSLIFLELLLPSSYMVGYTIEDVIEDILF